jgi:S-DNA-T family DNA segregation ATPase FtsK/SpoIIIE
MTPVDPSPPLSLPVPADPPRRATVPLIASVVPILGAGVLAAATGSYAMLWFAALGPLIAAATMLDGARAVRRDRRRSLREASAARERVAEEIESRHVAERSALEIRHPDAAALCFADAGVWRPVPGRREALTVGRGLQPSALRVTGGGTDHADVELRTRAVRLDGAPVAVPLADGVAVVGPEPVAEAVVRALVLQACLVRAPDELRVLAAPGPERAWVDELPHSRGGAGLAPRGGLTLAVCGPGAVVLPAADAVVACVRPGDPAPPQCGAVLTMTAPTRATLHHAGETLDVDVEAVAAVQARGAARTLTARSGGADRSGDGPVGLRELLAAPSPPAAQRGTLSAVIGRAERTPVAVDLVLDGPHAVVAGVTGSGKSELLTTWVTSLCAAHPPGDVTFLLVDFKGGTAFEPLRALPHVAGIITDLDEAGARRAVESLRAELRRREAALAAAGARDIREVRGELARLVIVVDEFAALLGMHPDLHAVFTDVAARGRALGLHLVLGTQRSSGVVRDALLANCPLRISLRVTDAADSRAVIGTDAAADLPGGPEARGLALVRRGADDHPQRVRIALADRDLVASIAERCAPVPAVVRPWLPELATRIPLADLVGAAPPPEPGELVIGLADEPDRQRQARVSLGPLDRGLVVLGSAGAGRSTAVSTLAAQVPDDRLLLVPGDPETAWDAVARALAARAGSVVAIDDLDALLARYPLDYAQAIAERIERLARGAGDAGVRIVVSVQRLTGTCARIVELIPRRLLLASASRTDHLAAGGTGELYRRHLPAGRGELDGRAVQVALARSRAAPQAAPIPEWQPSGRLTGVVVRTGTRLPPSVSSGHDVVELRTVADPSAIRNARSTVVVGDPEAWQRAWRVLDVVREENDLLIDASCAPDYRSLTGDRELPPYCTPGAGRAWLVSPGAASIRVLLPA